MNVFAGFWVDGAVRKPEQRHCDNDDTVLAKWKRKCNEQTIGVPNEFDICKRMFSKWEQVYWLDTTPRESLTPEELFSVLKIMWTELEYIKLHGNSWVFGEGAIIETPINWGSLTQYPPPIEPQWLRVTRENVGQYLFRECRTQRNDITYAGRIVGWCLEGDYCLVESDYKTDEPILQWDMVEVQV